MLTYKLTHPQILSALASAGHGSQVLITDGNYPHITGSNPDATHVFLNLTSGSAPVDEVLALLVDAVPVEAAQVMMPDSGREPPFFESFEKILPEDVGLRPMGRLAFYNAARGCDVALVIATGDRRHYANILLTIGALPEA